MNKLKKSETHHISLKNRIANGAKQGGYIFSNLFSLCINEWIDILGKLIVDRVY